MCLPWNIVIGLFLPEDASGSSADTTLSTKYPHNGYICFLKQNHIIIRHFKVHCK